jgi:capsular exopolysaccharide synthesis family protein
MTHFQADDPFGNLDAPLFASPRSLLLVCWQRKGLIVLGALVGLAAGLLLYAQRAPVYQATAQVLVVKKERPDVMPMSGADPRSSFYDDYVATHMMLIKSPLIVERAVQKRDLGALSSFAGRGNPAGAIVGGLETTRDTKDKVVVTNIFNLTYRGPEAEDCPVVVAAVIDSYQEFLELTYRGYSHETVRLVDDASVTLDKKLQEAKKKYDDFRENAPLLLKGKDGVNVHYLREAEVEAKKSELLIRAARIRERLQAIEQAKKENRSREELLALASQPLDKGAAAPPERNVEEALLPLVLQEKALLDDYGTGHPEVRAVRRKIALTREFYEGMSDLRTKAAGKAGDPVEAFVKALRQELQQVQVDQQALDRLRAEWEPEARQLEKFDREEQNLRGAVENLQQFFSGIMKRLQEINLVKEHGGYSAKVISPAGVGWKVAPTLWQFLFGGLFGGFLLGAGLAYLADVTDKSFRSPEEIRRRLGLPLVGHIPYLDESDAVAAQNGSAGEHHDLAPSLWVYHHPTSVEAEAYRGVRTSLYFSTQDQKHKVVQVTSPHMGDGKTTLAANLAVSIARSGKRVVLVDADFRRPSVHKLFGLAAEEGLTSHLVGEASLAEVTRAGRVEGLALIPCGARPTNPAELLSSPRFFEALRELRDGYDFVIVDTPPLLAVTDPCVVAGYVDGVLLVIRVSKNGRPAAERAREMLATHGARVYGVVVNGVGDKAHLKGYGYEHYHYDYEYGYEYSAQDAN